jgi:hypothetical protein
MLHLLHEMVTQPILSSEHLFSCIDFNHAAVLDKFGWAFYKVLKGTVETDVSVELFEFKKVKDRLTWNLGLE